MKHENEFRIATCKTPWNGFNLVRGHVFGVYMGVCYVSTAVPDERQRGFIRVYVDTPTKDCHRWAIKSIPAAGVVGRLIIAAQEANQYGGADIQEVKPRMSWRGKAGPCTLPEVEPPRMATMSQSRKDHYNPMPPMPKRAKTWVDQICREAMTVKPH